MDDHLCRKIHKTKDRTGTTLLWCICGLNKEHKAGSHICQFCHYEWTE